MGTGSGLGSGGVGVSIFGSAGVGVGFISSIGAGFGATGISDFGFLISDAGWNGVAGAGDELGEGRPGPGRREPRSIISTG